MMLCSIIIPTIGRETLTRSVESVLNQQFDYNKFEIIVINDSGKRLSQAKWHNHPNVQILQTQSREKSIAKNAHFLAAPNQCLTITEPTLPHTPFTPRQHIISAPAENIAAEIVTA